MNKLVLVPHNRGSHAVKDLANTLSQKLGYKVWRVAPSQVGRRVAFPIREGTDKLTQFERFRNASVSIPDFTPDRAVAAGWLRDGSVVCRTLLRSSEGKGIVVAENETQLVPAPLYTRYFKKKKEFRVHVFDGSVIDVQEKRRRGNIADEQRDTRIRNLANGYVFCRESISEPAGLRELATSAVAALGYHMGAVDIAWNERNNQLVVFEVNANPGLQGTTLENYANAIVGWYRSQA
jgi:glutathione synthase/RimK-type ligase-like ATP-grasp enzyme